MGSVVVDTHALVWYLSEPNNLSTVALSTIRQAVSAGDTVFLSAITPVEIRYLEEKSKLKAGTLEDLVQRLQLTDSGLVIVPVDLDIAQAMAQIPRDVVPDMPDRIIAATAAHLHLPLITRDAQIRASSITTIW